MKLAGRNMLRGKHCVRPTESLVPNSFQAHGLARQPRLYLQQTQPHPFGALERFMNNICYNDHRKTAIASLTKRNALRSEPVLFEPDVACS